MRSFKRFVSALTCLSLLVWGQPSIDAALIQDVKTNQPETSSDTPLSSQASNQTSDPTAQFLNSSSLTKAEQETAQPTSVTISLGKNAGLTITESADGVKTAEIRIRNEWNTNYTLTQVQTTQSGDYSTTVLSTTRGDRVTFIYSKDGRMAQYSVFSQDLNGTYKVTDQSYWSQSAAGVMQVSQRIRSVSGRDITERTTYDDWGREVSIYKNERYNQRTTVDSIQRVYSGSSQNVSQEIFTRSIEDREGKLKYTKTTTGSSVQYKDINLTSIRSRLSLTISSLTPDSNGKLRGRIQVTASDRNQLDAEMTGVEIEFTQGSDLQIRLAGELPGVIAPQKRLVTVSLRQYSINGSSSTAHKEVNLGLTSMILDQDTNNRVTARWVGVNQNWQTGDLVQLTDIIKVEQVPNQSISLYTADGKKHIFTMTSSNQYAYSIMEASQLISKREIHWINGQTYTERIWTKQSDGTAKQTVNGRLAPATTFTSEILFSQDGKAVKQSLVWKSKDQSIELTNAVLQPNGKYSGHLKTVNPQAQFTMDADVTDLEIQNASDMRFMMERPVELTAWQSTGFFSRRKIKVSPSGAGFGFDVLDRVQPQRWDFAIGKDHKFSAVQNDVSGMIDVVIWNDNTKKQLLSLKSVVRMETDPLKFRYPDQKAALFSSDGKEWVIRENHENGSSVAVYEVFENNIKKMSRAEGLGADRSEIEVAWVLNADGTSTETGVYREAKDSLSKVQKATSYTRIMRNGVLIRETLYHEENAGSYSFSNNLSLSATSNNAGKVTVLIREASGKPTIALTDARIVHEMNKVIVTGWETIGPVKRLREITYTPGQPRDGFYKSDRELQRTEVPFTTYQKVLSGNIRLSVTKNQNGTFKVELRAPSPNNSSTILTIYSGNLQNIKIAGGVGPNQDIEPGILLVGSTADGKEVRIKGWDPYRDINGIKPAAALFEAYDQGTKIETRTTQHLGWTRMMKSTPDGPYNIELTYRYQVYAPWAVVISVKFRGESYDISSNSTQRFDSGGLLSGFSFWIMPDSYPYPRHRPVITSALRIELSIAANGVGTYRECNDRGQQCVNKRF